MIRIAFFIMMAFGLAGFGTVAWIATRQSHSEAAPPPPPAKVAVLTAAHPINAGALIKPDDFATKQMVVEPGKAADFTIDTPDVRRALVGSMTRRAFAQGDVVREGDVIKPGEHGFLAAALQPGMRAVTITVDTGTGAGDLIGPGDRVDLILTQTLTDQNLPAAHRVAAETVLSDVRVLAIDQKLVLGASAPAPDRGNRTVTLEVTEGQAQRISVASLLGHLSLSVRSADGVQQMAETKQPNGVASSKGPAPAGKHQDPGTVWAVDVSPALGVTTGAPPVNGGSMRVFQGAADVKEFKF
ncbi:MAG TPA: Flp pilus assembly protein CpaB [Rhodopila sp.]|jgi:pilus assembly protein CpaB|nr:Flp pilus assembly protein CpaB [Rhodopila sp.]